MMKERRSPLWWVHPFVDRVEADTLLGDLEELYVLRRSKYGRIRTWLWLMGQLGRSYPAYVWHNLSWRSFMGFNYLKIAFRNMKRQKGVAFINVFGLGLGMALSLMIVLYLHYENHYDAFHTQKDRIYRILFKFDDTYMGKSFMSQSPAPLAPALKSHLPEIEAAASVRVQAPRLKQGDQYIYDGQMLYADADFFKMFDFPVQKGDLYTGLQEPFAVALSEKMAAKYFPKQDALGQTLTIGDHLYRVIAVMKEVPVNSHIQFDWATSYDTFLKIRGQTDRQSLWMDYACHTYFSLNPHVEASSFLEKLKRACEEFVPQRAQVEELNNIHIQPLKDIHFETRTVRELTPPADKKRLLLFSGVALAILLIASFNYINLTTACTSRRAKEVGLRKVVGAAHRQLIHQFMAEAGLTLFLGLLIAVELFVLLINPFSQYMGQDLERYLLMNPMVMLLLLVVFVVIGLFTSLYPALSLARLRPARIFRDYKSSGARQKGRFRDSMVIVQFVLTVIFIFGMLTTHRQFHFMLTKDTGYNKTDIVAIHTLAPSLPAEQIRAELLNLPGVVDATCADQLITSIGDAEYGYWEATPVDSLLFHTLHIMPNYFSFYGIPLKEGRTFRAGETWEDRKYIVNQAALDKMGGVHGAGRRFSFIAKNKLIGEVIGVVSDFHFQSLHQPVSPLVIKMLGGLGGLFQVKVASENRHETVALIEDLWKKLGSSDAFSYDFVDRQWANLYQEEEHFNQSFTVFSLLAVVIASMGLAGLTLFAVQKRRKEIGIRKVLGATDQSIFMLVCRDFLLRIVVAVVVAWPCGYWLMNRWLERFPYRIALSWDLFALSGLLTGVIALFTVSFQSIKASQTRPAATIRTD